MESLWQKLNRVVRKYLGKKVDYDKAYGNQCVDFARQFAAESFSPIGTFSGSALNGWKTGSPFNYKWSRNVYRKGMIPNPGDIVFFDKTSKNPYGHVAIAWAGSNANELQIVEQNAGTGNGDGVGSNAITQRVTSYVNGTRGNCLGWFSYNG